MVNEFTFEINRILLIIEIRGGPILMNTVLLVSRLDLEEIDLLLKEFPQYLFLSVNGSAYPKLEKKQLQDVEIIYGNRLTPEELSHAPRLRWIHATGSQLDKICLDEIQQRGNMIVTKTPDENIDQIGEFVIAGLLTFAKNMIHWADADHYPALLWDSKWRDRMWTLKGKTLLQIGLGRVGTEIARRSRQFEMTVWGIDAKKTFHPYCNKTFDFKMLHSVLPAVDIVSIALPPGKEFTHWFGDTEFEHMKNDSILSVVGSHTIIDAAALLKYEQEEKFRGVMIDAQYSPQIPQDSPLWSLRKKIITPEVSPMPKSKERQAFRLFIYNLRQYEHSNFKDFRNVVPLQDTGAIHAHHT